MTMLEYKGYVGSVEVDVEDHVIFGRLLYIRDVITYRSDSPKDIEAAFRDAVDEYLTACAEDGTEPDVPFKGSFNVRVGPDRHRDVALLARRRGIGLNDFVVSAIDSALNPPPAVHQHYVVQVLEPAGAFTVTGSADPWSWPEAQHGRA